MSDLTLGFLIGCVVSTVGNITVLEVIRRWHRKKYGPAAVRPQDREEASHD